MIARITSLAVTPRPNSPSTLMAKVLGRSCSRHWVASTWPTSLVPMPKASAPNAPWVLVWLSPQTMVVPGWVMPISGPTTWTMPCTGPSMSNKRDAEVLAVLAQRADLRGRVAGPQRHVALRLAGRDGVVHGREGTVGPAYGQAALAQRGERLRRRHLVHQMRIDVQHRRRAGILHDHMRVPDLLKKRSWLSVVHCVSSNSSSMISLDSHRRGNGVCCCKNRGSRGSRGSDPPSPFKLPSDIRFPISAV